MFIESLIIIGIIFAIFYFYGDTILQKISNATVNTAQKTATNTATGIVQGIPNVFKDIFHV
jgi:hypothetical protein